MSRPTPPSTLAGRFTPALEDAYQADLADEKLRVFGLACLLCSLLFLCFGLLDLVAVPSNVVGAWTVRTIVVLATAVAAVVARSRREFFLRHYTAIVCLVFLGWAAGVETIILLSHEADPGWNGYYVGVLLVLIGLYTWTYLPPIHAGLASLALIVTYVTLALFRQHMGDGRHWVTLVQNCFFLAGANVAGHVSLAMRERFSRHAFLLKNALAHELRLEEEAKRQSQHLSEHDALTGLPNRIRFLRSLGELLAAREQATTVAVLFLDLDGFKQVNDRHGHAAGDHVLAVIAERIRGAIRSSDNAARLGGDEFVIALPLAQYQGELIVERVSAALRTALAEPIVFKGLGLQVSASIGSAICTEDPIGAEQLVHLADQSMYELKRRRAALLTS